MATMETRLDPDRQIRPIVTSGLRPGAVLDLDHLRRFTAGNRELEREVLDLFAAQAPLTLRVMQLARSEKAWRDAAHTLKGSAFAVGANAIARTAAEAELVRSDPQRWPDLIERLDQAIREANTFIRSAR